MEIPESYRQRDAAIEASRSLIECGSKMHLVDYLRRTKSALFTDSFKEMEKEIGVKTSSSALAVDIHYALHNENEDVIGIAAERLLEDAQSEA